MIDILVTLAALTLTALSKNGYDAKAIARELEEANRLEKDGPT